MVREAGKSYFALTKIQDAKGKCFADKGNILTLLQISGILVLVTNGIDKFSINQDYLSICPHQPRGLQISPN